MQFLQDSWLGSVQLVFRHESDVHFHITDMVAGVLPWAVSSQIYTIYILNVKLSGVCTLWK